MDWRLKVPLHWLISSAPFSHNVQFAFQRLNGSFPVSDQVLEEKLNNARRHAAVLEASDDGILFEFGTGWDLLQPLVMWSLGYRRQVLIDINPLARVWLVTDIARRLRKRGFPSIGPVQRLADLSFYGIQYLAPADARRTQLEDGSVRCIVSTSTLEHIPREDIAAIFRECYRILASAGRMSLIIDHQDHWSYADPSIDRFNFRRYSTRAWWYLNPPTHWQNRLQHSDYITLLENNGFHVTSAEASAEESGSHIVARKA
jgi:hypothetical protein